MAKRSCCPWSNSGKFPEGNTERPRALCPQGKHWGIHKERKCYHRSLLIFLHLIFSFYFSFLHDPHSLQDKESLLRHSPYDVLQITAFHPSFLMFCTPVHTRLLILCFSIYPPSCLVPHIPLLIHQPHTAFNSPSFALLFPLSITHTASILHLHSWSFLSSFTSYISTLLLNTNHSSLVTCFLISLSRAFCLINIAQGCSRSFKGGAVQADVCNHKVLLLPLMNPGEMDTALLWLEWRWWGLLRAEPLQVSHGTLVDNPLGVKDVLVKDHSLGPLSINSKINK